MKSTGVIRRIDDLGRIVIPKEIRKTMRIKNGESLEIFLESNNIVLKKYSDFDDVLNFFNMYVNSINDVINENIMISNRNKIIICSGKLKNKYLDLNISPFLENIMTKRSITYSKDIVDVCLVNGINSNLSYVVAPIISNSDILGAIILLSENKNVDDFDIKLINMSSKFLGKYIE